MKHTWRFFGSLRSSDQKHIWTIDPNEYRQIKKVLRLSLGDLLEVQDDEGNWSRGKLARIDHESGMFGIITNQLNRVEKQSPNIHIGLGIVKADKWQSLVSQLVEIGVDSLYMFGQYQTPKKYMEEKFRSKLESISIGAAKLAKRPYKMKVDIFTNISEFLPLCAQTGSQKIYLQKSENTPTLENSPKSNDIFLCIGGERGFSEEEVKALNQAGFSAKSMGPFTLQATTAALAACAALRFSIK